MTSGGTALTTRTTRRRPTTTDRTSSTRSTTATSRWEGTEVTRTLMSSTRSTWRLEEATTAWQPSLDPCIAPTSTRQPAPRECHRLRIERVPKRNQTPAQDPKIPATPRASAAELRAYHFILRNIHKIVEIETTQGTEPQITKNQCEKQ